MSILVLGTVALDSVKTPYGARKEMLGGSAVHFSMSARIFTKVILVSIIGKDFPQKHLKFLHKKGIILASLIKTQGKTFRWQGEYRADMNAAITLATELGVLNSFRLEVREHHRKIRNIFLANVDPDIQASLLDTMHLPGLVGLDSMNYWINNKKKRLLKVMQRADLFVANDQEARSLTSEHNLYQAAKCLLRLGPKIVVIKKGEHGVIFYSKGLMFSLPAYPVHKVVDPTGAGDTFAGALMGYLSTQKKINSQHLRKALAYATVSASFNVEGFGVNKTKDLTRQDIESRLKKFRLFTNF
ncbi:MAG: PfkB family carbohydrate kinase [Candidatus Omnitrophota bacterium]